MVTVEFLGPIKRDTISVEAETIADIAKILSQDTEIKDWLKNAAVALNDTIVKSLDTELKEGDKISILPPVCGG